MNVILVVVDTLRADHMSVHGYHRRTTPFIDELARDGVTFDAFRSQCSHTLPSFTSIVTGQSPFTHGVISTTWDLPNSLRSQFPLASKLLAEILSDAGYATCAVDNLFSFSCRPEWFVRGYRHLVNLTSATGTSHQVVAEEEVTVQEAAD